MMAVGENFNSCDCNILSDIKNYGLVYAFNNEQSQFLQNSFEMADYKAVYTELAALPEIGSVAEPAGNCFENSATDIVLSGNNMTYHYFAGTSETCQEPDVYGIASILGTEAIFDHCDGNIGIFSLINPSGGGTDETGLPVVIVDPVSYPDSTCLPCLIDSIDVHIDEVVNAGGDDPRTVPDEEVSTISHPQLPSYEEEMTQWINYAIYVALETDDDALVSSVLGPLKKWKWQKRLFGYHLSKNNIAQAEALLTSLSTSSANETNFKAIQQINIKRLKGIKD